MKNTKRLYLDVRSTQDRKTTANAGLGNYAIELRGWIQKLIDGGQISLANSPTGGNITTGTLAVATGSRIADLGLNDLTFNNVVNFISNSIVKNEFSTVSGANSSRVRTTPSYAYLYSQGSSFITEISANSSGGVTLYSTAKNYRIGINSSTTPDTFSSSTDVPFNINVLNTTGQVYKTDTSALFVSNTQINPSSAGAPTRTEILTFITSQSAAYQGAAKNRIIYYTGTDAQEDAYTYAYYLTGDLKLFVIDKP